MLSLFKLKFLKLLVNVPMRLLDKLLKFPKQVDYPQTEVLLRVYEHMIHAYRVEAQQGPFRKADGNFERLLRVSYKLLANMSENDPYYRAWLGLTFILAKNELASLNLNPEQIKLWLKIQWFQNIDDLPDSLIMQSQEDFTEIVLASYLCNIAQKNPA